jgi:hypothetical protein
MTLLSFQKPTIRVPEDAHESSVAIQIARMQPAAVNHLFGCSLAHHRKGRKNG